MMDHLHEDFATTEEAQAFVLGLTYGDEPDWIVEDGVEEVPPGRDEHGNEHDATRYRVRFDRPEEYEEVRA